MFTDDILGFWSIPANGLGIVRARTLLGNLRLWDIPRSESALLQVIHEIGQEFVPGLYVLMEEGGKKVYVGQTESLATRLATHIKTPESKIKNWQRCLIFNEGRGASQSDLNDENIRLALEDYLVSLFKVNRYHVVTSATRAPALSPQQQILVNAFRQEINILLSNKGKVSRFLVGRRDDEVHLEEAKKILLRRGHAIQKWGAQYAVIDAAPVVIRPGSLKEKGWQVTFRGSKSLAQLKRKEGFLLMPRGRMVLVPLREVAGLVLSADANALNRDTVDVFVRFEEERIVLAYKGREQDITAFSVEPYSES